MEAAGVVVLVEAFERQGRQGLARWRLGVDALLGEQTREHDDLDLVLAVEDMPAAERTLEAAGYRYAHGPSTNPEWYDATSRQVDLHPVAFDEQGNGIYTMADGSTWPYPARGFAGRGSVQGRGADCLTPEVQMLCHAG
jgi:lincosamide nucleotidyltransferase A/C/D/E